MPFPQLAGQCVNRGSWSGRVRPGIVVDRRQGSERGTGPAVGNCLVVTELPVGGAATTRRRAETAFEPDAELGKAGESGAILGHPPDPSGATPNSARRPSPNAVSVHLVPFLLTS